MTATLIDSLSAAGVQLWAEGERLKFAAPVGALPPELKAELAARKAELLALLSAPHCADCGLPLASDAGGAHTFCPTCGIDKWEAPTGGTLADVPEFPGGKLSLFQAW